MTQHGIRELTNAPTAAPENEQALASSLRLIDEIAAAQEYRAKAKAANTLRAYQSDWNQFDGWCDERGLEPLPARPEAVATYLAALATKGLADSTITPLRSDRLEAWSGWPGGPTGARWSPGDRGHARRHPP